MNDQRKTSHCYGLSYAHALPTLTNVARKHGYALAVHGSMATDLDLIAVPWIEEVSHPDVLAEALRECVGGMFSGGQDATSNATVKTHGRIAYNILPSNLFLGVPKLKWSPWIDLSVIPSVKETLPLKFIEENA